jgi:hypothetical protein
MKFLNKYSKKIFRVLGIIGVVVSAYFLITGGICLFSNSMSKDSEGYFSTWTVKVKKDSYAIVLGPDGINFGGGLDTSELTTLKVETSNNDPSTPIFIGIVGETDIEAYLNGVDYDEITGLRILPSRAIYQNYPGSVMPGNPRSQTFWFESAYGSGIQSLIWNPEPDRHYLVIMNEDGSAGLDIHLVIRTKVALLFIAGAANLIVGVFVLLLSLLLLLSSRKSRNVVYPQPLELMSQERTKPKTDS